MSKQMKRSGSYALPFLMVGAAVMGVRYHAQARGGSGEQLAWGGAGRGGGGSSEQTGEAPRIRACLPGVRPGARGVRGCSVDGGGKDRALSIRHIDPNRSDGSPLGRRYALIE